MKFLLNAKYDNLTAGLGIYKKEAGKAIDFILSN